MRGTQVLFLSTLLTISSPSVAQTKDPVYSYSAGDTQMNAAIAKARSTLPTFYKHWKLHSKKETDFALKVRISDGEKVEHFWLADLQGTPGHLTGVVNNDPEVVHTVKIGQRMAIAPDKISDWTYLLNGKIVGNYTMRVMLKELSPEQQKKAKQIFANP